MTSGAPRRILLPVLLCCAGLAAALALSSQAAAATLINSLSHGDDLSGGTLTVTFQTAGAKQADIQSGPGADEGTASEANFFSFSMNGETFLGKWVLNNLTASDYIVSAVFNLAGSQAVFDKISPVNAMDTPGSENGRPNILHDAGVVHASDAKSVAWTDPINKGDLFLVETITWNQNAFGPGKSSSWLDDTDDWLAGPVPEPSTAALLGLGLLAMAAARRR